MEKYQITIGIECHVQLATITKLFSAVVSDGRGEEPNTCLSPVDYALPGALPVLNRGAVVLAVRAGKALNATVNLFSRFDRKHYYYPDLPKGYQITQLYHPIIGAGSITLPSGTTVRIEHAHLEEDAGKLTHFSNYSLVDLNRAGTPLLEIVSMPDIHSASDAAAYCKELWRALTFAGVTQGDLYHGNMRFDINISLAPIGSDQLGIRTEIKNLNSFRSVERAVIYEAARQAELLDAGESIVQETRGWSDDTGETSSQRQKVGAISYGYFPDPDLPPVQLTAEDIMSWQSDFPLLPADYRRLFADALPSATIEVLLDHQNLCAALADSCGLTSANDKLDSSLIPLAKKLANLMPSVLLAEENLVLLSGELPSAARLKSLVEMLLKGSLSSTAGKTVLLELFNSSDSPEQIAERLGLIQENDTDALSALVDTIIADPACAAAVADYRAGQEKVLGFLVGQVMKASKGKANPSTASDLLRQKLQN